MIATETAYWELSISGLKNDLYLPVSLLLFYGTNTAHPRGVFYSKICMPIVKYIILHKLNIPHRITDDIYVSLLDFFLEVFFMRKKDRENFSILS
jgi:hypothetical protein